LFRSIDKQQKFDLKMIIIRIYFEMIISLILK
jgi:hypothetical protein